MKPDKDTINVQKEGEQMQELVESEQWKRAKLKLFERITDASSILGIENSDDPTKMIQELAAKQMAVEMVLDWLSEVEGIASQHKNQNRETLNTINRDYYLKYFGESEQGYN